MNDDQEDAAGLSDFDGDEGACIKCGYEDELDSIGLCGSCDPLSKEDQQTLVRAMKPETKG
jgi:hypothetical protein